MWIGNIPRDATEDELLAFCAQSLSSQEGPGNGILSLHLISYTNCAFVNFDSRHSLEKARLAINHRPLRPNDSDCLPLVCKVRTAKDGLYAGVNIQRGTGLHVQWVREQRRLRRNERLCRLGTVIDSNRLQLEDLSESESDSELGSDASTTSSLLRDNFKTRYFILKSSDEVSLSFGRTKKNTYVPMHSNLCSVAFKVANG
jgi:RNA recognition motif-containing protein